MGLLSWVADGISARNPADDRWYGSNAGAVALSGVRVSPDTAPKASAVYACGSLISESLAILPLLTYRQLAGGARERDPDHPMYRLLHRRPNPRHTPFQFKQYSQWNVLFRGACYARYRPASSRSEEDWLEPLHPDLVRRELLSNGQLRFQVKNAEQDREDPVLQEDMFWVDGLSLDGVNPVSVITFARESIGLALAVEEFGARVFSQGALHSGALKHKGNLSQPAQERLSEQFQLRTSGLVNAHRPIVMEEGMEWVATSMTVEDAQTIAMREFQVADIARWFRVPLHMIGQTTGETSWGSGIEQLSRGFVTYTLLPWLVRWEEAVTRDLIGDDDPEHFVEFLADALLRADIKTRYEAHQIAAGGNAPWASREEVRRMENLPPRDDQDLDEILIPLNMATIKQANRMPLPTDPPGPRPASEGAPPKDERN